jgi:site-specific recombinase XerD
VENSFVFCRSTGNPLTDHDVWLQFRRITEKAGLGTDWSPRELRHTFVSLLSDSGRPDRADRGCGRPLQHLDN